VCRQGVVRDGDETLLVYYGDILSSIDLGEMLKRHDESGAVATVAVVRGYRVPVGVVDLRDGWVERLVEKPTLELYDGEWMGESWSSVIKTLSYC